MRAPTQDFHTGHKFAKRHTSAGALPEMLLASDALEVLQQALPLRMLNSNEILLCLCLLLPSSSSYARAAIGSFPSSLSLFLLIPASVSSSDTLQLQVQPVSDHEVSSFELFECHRFRSASTSTICAAVCC
eukprot:2479298-Rhodomonas_salina.1